MVIEEAVGREDGGSGGGRVRVRVIVAEAGHVEDGLHVVGVCDGGAGGWPPGRREAVDINRSLGFGETVRLGRGS